MKTDPGVAATSSPPATLKFSTKNNTSLAAKDKDSSAPKSKNKKYLIIMTHMHFLKITSLGFKKKGCN